MDTDRHTMCGLLYGLRRNQTATQPPLFSEKHLVLAKGIFRPLKYALTRCRKHTKNNRLNSHIIVHSGLLDLLWCIKLNPYSNMAY